MQPGMQLGDAQSKISNIEDNLASRNSFRIHNFHTIHPNATKQSLCTTPCRELFDGTNKTIKTNKLTNLGYGLVCLVSFPLYNKIKIEVNA